MLILPGVVGHSHSTYVWDIAYYALTHGYQPVVINSVITKENGQICDNLRVLDFTRDEAMRSAVDVVHQ